METENKENCKCPPKPIIPRKIENHKVNQVNDLIDIASMDAQGAGGANHWYRCYWPTPDHPVLGATCHDIHFQNGPISENGVNGITQEILLAIVEDRLISFQAGPYACEENGRALDLVSAALAELKGRTLKRMQRGVEGTHKV